MIAQLAEAGFDIVHPFDAHGVARALAIDALFDAERPCGWIVGNTRALWPRFLAARRADPELAASRDPLDRYVEQTCAKLAGTRCLFVHRSENGAYLPFQRIAAAAGLGTVGPSQLLVHPTYGPWLGLRAIVLVAGTPITRVLPRPPCECAERCASAFDRARDVHSSWHEWLAARDACCVGREHRYGDDQIAYHYTKDHAHLR
jgi:methylmalonic aciduria homocystinuria type C protein